MLCTLLGVEENWRLKNYLISPIGLRNSKAAAGDTAQLLSEHTAPTGDLSLVPNIPIRGLTVHAITPAPREQSSPLASWAPDYAHTPAIMPI